MIQTVKELGAVKHKSHPKWSNRMAGVALAMLCLIGGGLMISYGVDSLTTDRVVKDRMARGVSMIVLGAGVCVVGLFLVWYVSRLFSFTLVVCEHGFYFTRFGAITIFAWQDIAGVMETINHTKLTGGAIGDALPTTDHHSYAVYRQDQLRFDLDNNLIANPARLIDDLRRASKSIGFKWMVTEVRT